MILRAIATLQDYYLRFRDRKDRCPYKPHPYQHRRGTPGGCPCGDSRSARVHQPRSWRWLHPRAEWRQ